MLVQLPEEKRDLIKPLFQKKQPNNSALWCYLDGKMTGKTFVDDITSPTKAIWACDEENAESVRLAKRLGFTNPVEYEFLYFPTRN